MGIIRKKIIGRAGDFPFFLSNHWYLLSDPFINCIISFFKEQKETLNTALIHLYSGVSMRRDVHVGLISTIFVMLFIAACFAGCTNQAPTATPTVAPTTAAPVVTATPAAPAANITVSAPAANTTAAASVANVTVAAPAGNVTAAAPAANATAVAPTGGPGRTN
jgi:hypothetical protein